MNLNHLLPLIKTQKLFKLLLYEHGLKGHSAMEKPLLQKQHKARKRLKYSGKQIHVPWCDEIKIEVLGHNGQCVLHFGGKRKKPPIQQCSTVVAESCCVAILLLVTGGLYKINVIMI